MPANLSKQVVLGAYKNISIKLREKKKFAVEVLYVSGAADSFLC